MTEQIELGGKKRHMRFGFAALLKYEQETGRNAFKDFAELTTDSGIGGISVQVMVDLAYYGLVCGHEKVGTNVDFDKFDVADWMGEPGKLFETMQMFSKSLESINEGNAPAGQPSRPTRTVTKGKRKK